MNHEVYNTAFDSIQLMLFRKAEPIKTTASIWLEGKQLRTVSCHSYSSWCLAHKDGLFKPKTELRLHNIDYTCGRGNRTVRAQRKSLKQG